MKNLLYLSLGLVLMSSCASLKQVNYYEPYDFITDTLSQVSFKSNNRKQLNSSICKKYWRQAQELESLLKCDVVTLPRLNAWASKAVGDVLKNKPFAAKITDAIGVTRFAKTMSEGNTHIFYYATSVWNDFIQYFKLYPHSSYDSFWKHLTSVYPELLNPTIRQINPLDGKHYNYSSFLQYYKALQITESTIEKNELILLGNLYFILGEQTLAQTFITKALSLFRIGCNPLNIPGRLVKAQVGSKVYSNTEITSDPELKFINMELLKLIEQHAVEEQTVKYHKYDERMAFLFNLAIQSHQDPTSFNSIIFNSL